MADGWETADRPPVYRLQKLPPPDPGRPAFVHLGLPQNLCTPGGARALIRHGPGKANQWIHVLLPALLAALRALDDASARSLSALAQHLGVSEAETATVVTPFEEESPPVVAIPTAAPAAPLLPMTAPSGASSAPKTLLNRPSVIAARKRTTPSTMACSSMPCSSSSF
jgi:hypothetical protein